MSRKKLPPLIQKSVLTESRRRCCLCFGLNSELSIKKGQIAHIDHDSSNNQESNLVFLCFEHHDEYDSTTRQSKGLTKDEVVFYREQLLKQIEKGLSYETFSYESRNSYEMQIKHDQKIFETSDSIMSEDNLNTLLYQLSQHFYFLEYSNKMENYWRFFGKSSNSFVRPEISTSNKELIQSLYELDEFLCYKFFVEDGHTENPRFRLQPDIKYSNNAKYIELSKQLDDLCLQVRKSYEKFRIQVKRNLFI